MSETMMQYESYADPVDAALASAEADREARVARLRAEAAARRRQPSRAFCVECEEPIPEKRRALGGVQYCVDCQELIDRNNQLYGR